MLAHKLLANGMAGDGTAMVHYGAIAALFHVAAVDIPATWAVLFGVLRGLHLSRHQVVP